MKDRLRNICKTRKKQLATEGILIIISIVFLLIIGNEKGVFLTKDSKHYLFFAENTVGVAPIYPCFLKLNQLIFDEQVFLYAVVLEQLIIAIICNFSLTNYLQKRFQLGYFSYAICYCSLLLLYGIDYNYAIMPHQIMTEGLAFPIFYIFFKYILKSVWESPKKNTLIHVCLAIILSLIRTQLKLLIGISALGYIYISIKNHKKYKKNFVCILQALIISITMVIGGLKAGSIMDRSLQAIYFSPVQESVSKQVVTLESISSNNDQQINMALAGRIWFLAEKNDNVLFENADVRKIFEISYAAMDKEKKTLAQINPSLLQWRGLTNLSRVTQIAYSSVLDYQEQHPGELSLSYDQALPIIMQELFKAHWYRYIEHSLIFFGHGLLCTVIWDNEAQYEFCYIYTLIVYLLAIILTCTLYSKKKCNREVCEFMLIVLLINLAMVGVTSILFMSIKRYVCYLVGIFYVSLFLMGRELYQYWKETKNLK